MFVEVSNVSSSCFKSKILGRWNAGFILFIVLDNLLIGRCSFHDTETLAAAAAAAFAVYGRGEFWSISVSISFDDDDALSLSCNSTVSGSVFIVWFELPMNISIRCVDAGDLFSISSPYRISSLESGLAVFIVLV